MRLAGGVDHHRRSRSRSQPSHVPSGTLVTGDSREGKTADTLRFCGVGAQAAGDKSDYAGFLRIAFRSALEARYTAASLGFRCARDAEGDSR